MHARGTRNASDATGSETSLTVCNICCNCLGTTFWCMQHGWPRGARLVPGEAGHSAHSARRKDMGKRPSNFRCEEPAGGPGALLSGLHQLKQRMLHSGALRRLNRWHCVKFTCVSRRRLKQILGSSRIAGFFLWKPLWMATADGGEVAAKHQATMLKQPKPRGACFPISSLLPSSAKTYWTVANFLL